MRDSAGERLVAIVIPWFGRNLRGGAELQAWNLASRLAGRGYPIEVLTTCCGSFQDDWSSNFHPPGLASETEGFSVRRFPVEPRDRASFDRVCGTLLGLDPSTLRPGVSPISDEDERIFCEHLIRCRALLAYLKSDGWRYSAFIFLPYLYGPTLEGLPLVAAKAFLQPCLHNESYAYLRCVQRAFRESGTLLWNCEGEQELAFRLFGPGIAAKSVVTGEGVEPVPMCGDDPDFKQLEALAPFVLLLGRKDEGKGTPLAVRAFNRHHRTSGSKLKLVIAGPGDADFGSPDDSIHDLGLVSERHRSWLLRHAKALLQPSSNESFSRVMFEAWQCGIPVVVRQSCLATACAVEACNGGLLAETEEEWAAALFRIESSPVAELAAAGSRGASYAARMADWNTVIDRYDTLLSELASADPMAIRIRCAFSSHRQQTVRLNASDRELASMELKSAEVVDTGWLDHIAPSSEVSIDFETDRSGAKVGADPRTLGFLLNSLAVETKGGEPLDLRFSVGWNRSEGVMGIPVPRWSTGCARVLARRRQDGRSKRAIHQLLPNLSYGDAISNHAVWIRDRLHLMGYESEIYARHIDSRVHHQAYHYASPESVPAHAAVIYHHSIGTEITPWASQHPSPKALIYHNITPADFFEPYRPEFAAICRQGRNDLPGLAPYFEVSVGDSRYNASELAELGFRDPGVLPLCIDPAHWSTPADETIMARLQDHRANILFVGRIVPNKRFEDLIYTFKFWLEFDPEARLFLVGGSEVSSFYLECLQELARRLRVDHAVHFVGRVDDGQLNAYYRCASMFWCFSRHEGFCAPLIEAMWFDVPVVAVRSSAVGETMQNAGLMVEPGMRPDALAAMIHKRLADPPSRKALVQGQRARRTSFLPDAVERHLRHLVTRIGA